MESRGSLAFIEFSSATSNYIALSGFGFANLSFLPL